jgi:hypothetical protein
MKERIIPSHSGGRVGLTDSHNESKGLAPSHPQFQKEGATLTEKKV